MPGSAAPGPPSDQPLDLNELHLPDPPSLGSRVIDILMTTVAIKIALLFITVVAAVGLRQLVIDSVGDLVSAPLVVVVASACMAGALVAWTVSSNPDEPLVSQRTAVIAALGIALVAAFDYLAFVIPLIAATFAVVRTRLSGRAGGRHRDE